MQTTINLWPGLAVTVVCQLHVYNLSIPLHLSAYTFDVEMGTSTFSSVNWKVLGKLTSCITSWLDFNVRAKY